MVQPLQNLVGELYKHTPFYVPKQALLVQQDEDRRENINLISEMLKRRGYKKILIGPEECKREYILESIDELAHNSRSNSSTFFYYAGHGYQDYIPELYSGIMLNGNASDFRSRRIIPPELFESLGKVRGKKAVIIDACLSGEFVDYLKLLQRLREPLITDYVLITATTRESFSINALMDITKGTHLEGRKITPLVYWMYTSAEREKINLASIPITELTMSEDALRVLQERNHKIDIQKIDLRIQRLSDTDFVL